MGNELMVDLQSVLTLIGDAILLRANDPEQFHYPIFLFQHTQRRRGHFICRPKDRATYPSHAS